MLRAPKETWWLLDGCALRLTPRAEPLTGKGNPSFLARRLQHSRFAATTSLAAPIDNNVSAGLVAFQNETHYYYLGVRRTAEGLSVFLERANGKTPELVASAKLSDIANLQLRLTGEEKNLSFAYMTTPGSWQTLIANADVTPITVQAAGGGLHFTGAVLGLHARVEQ
jgi:alpha-N-arabinofuranosidase